MNFNFKVFQNFLFSFYVFLFGGFDSLFKCLLIVIFLDYITGIFKALYNKNLSSKECLRGIIKKFGYLLITILATVGSRIIGDETMAIRTLVIYFFIGNEAISILENWAELGLPLPKKLYTVFSNLKEEKNDEKSY